MPDKTPEELTADQIQEVERQLKFFKEHALELKKTHPDRWEEDVKRLEVELSTLKPKKVEDKKGKK